MDTETPLQPLKTITPAAQNNINTKFILVDKERLSLEGQNKTDETASVHFQLWGDECDAFVPEDIIVLTNVIFSYNRNNMVLRAGKRGKIEKFREFCMAFVETPNLSEIRWGFDPGGTKKFVQLSVISHVSHIFPPSL